MSLPRILLNVGGNDITEFLFVLLERIGFPYRDLDLARSYDWDVMEDLKFRIVTLFEVCGFPSALTPLGESLRKRGLRLIKGTKHVDADSLPLKEEVELGLYDFVVRRPGAPAEKYGLRAYDEIILAPMVSQFFRSSLF